MQHLAHGLGSVIVWTRQMDITVDIVDLTMAYTSSVQTTSHT